MQRNVWLVGMVLLAVGFSATAEVVRINVAGADCQLASAGTGPKEIKVRVEGNDGEVLLVAMLRRYDEKKYSIFSKPERVASTGTLAFSVKELGFYDLRVVALRDKEEIAHVDSNYAVVPPTGYDPPADMGTCTHFAQGKGAYPLSFDLLKLAGFTRIRDDLAWSHVEKKPGVYAMPARIEQLVDTAREYGIKPLLVTGYNNGVAYPGKFEKAFVTTPEMREAYGNAVAFAVAHFGDRVGEWELWNEPNRAHPVKDYLEMLKVVYPKAKKANPKATIISCGGGGAGGGPGGGMIVPIARAGGVEYMDAFSIHPYMAPHDPDYGYGAKNSPIPRVSVPVFSRFLERVINENRKKDGGKLSMWVTELGWPTEHPAVRQYGTSPLLQAAYFARTYLLFRREGSSEGVFWYDFQNDGLNAKEKEHNFGIIRKDFSPKPAYQAAAVVASVLRNRPFAKALRDDTSKIFVYGKAGDEMVAIWSPMKDAPFKPADRCCFPLPFPADDAKCIDWQGRERKLAVEAGQVVLKSSFLPQYIIRK